MTPDRDGDFLNDAVLDSLLDEVLGGRTPPDLTERIMSAWSARQQVAAEEQPLEPPPILAGAYRAVEPPPINGHRMVELPAPANALATTRKAVRRWPISAVALGTVALSIVACVLALNLDWNPELAGRPEARDVKAPDSAVAGTFPEVTPPKAERVPPARKLRPKPMDDASQIAESQPPANVPDVSPSVTAPSVTAPGVTPQETAPQVAQDQPGQIGLPADSPYRHRQAPEGIVSFVNAELARSWSAAGVTPAAPATDAEWCRRLYVRILGRTPTADELAAFTKQKNADRREKLVERLLTASEHVAEFADNWAGVFTNVLLGRTGGGARSLASREEVEKYFRSALLADKPYDQVVSELLTATGSAKPGPDDYNPAVNFLLDGFDGQATLATARVARVFLGTQLQCAQCHVHPTQNWSQEQYWSLNSFFRQMKAERGVIARLTNVDFSGEGRSSRGGEVFFETPAGLLKSAYPKFIDGKEIPQSGQLAEVDRRAELAKFVVQSDRLPRALVNRVWAHFFGYGFTSGTDNVSESAAHEALLDRLADQFVAHDFDLKALIEWVALSDPFARSSKLSDLATKDMPEAGEVALFSRYYLRQMQPEEVVKSLVHAAQIRSTTSSAADLQKARVDWLSQFNRSMGTDDGQEESHFSGVRQSLMMMNGDLMRKAVSSQQGGILKTLSTSEMPFDKKVEHLFLSALSRQPSAREVRAANTILTRSNKDQAAALEDIWWAILNSNEFILDH